MESFVLVEIQKPLHAFTPGFLSLEHAAEFADVSVKTVKRWIERGLPKYQARPGSKVLIRPTDIERFLTKKCNRPQELDSLVQETLKNLNVS